MSRFDEPPIKMKLGDILKTFTNSTFAMDTNIQTAMEGASPIWDLLGITEEQYHIKYPPVDLSGAVVDISENVIDVSGADIKVDG
jgi:hypothetical protein